MGSFPNFTLFIQESWAPGGSENYGFSWPIPDGNVVIGTNPPYTASDFLSFYPKFGGTPLNLTGTITQGSNTVSLYSIEASVAIGQLVTGPQIPPGTFIVDIPDSQTLVLSKVATANGSVISVYNQPFVPMYVLQLYVNLASASLVQARWLDSWPIGMSLFIAHFCTLYLQSDGDLYSTPGQAAVAGLSRGIATSKSAGDVSVGYTPVTPGIDTWGAWNLTSYGQQFATMAVAIGSGPMWIY